MDNASAATIIALVPPEMGPADSAPLRKGTVLFGADEVLEGPLGGGKGHAYKCRRQRLNNEILWAIKGIRPDLKLPKLFTELFIREARALSKVRHDAVARCQDLRRNDGQFFLVMEFVEGPSLRQLFKERWLTTMEGSHSSGESRWV